MKTSNFTQKPSSFKQENTIDESFRLFLKTPRAVLLQLLFPRVCPVCGKILPKKITQGEEPPFICSFCEKKLHYPEEPRCLCCSKSVSDPEEEFCEDCRKRKRFFDHGKSLLIHDDYARRILYDLKFGNRRDNADFLGYEMAKQFGDMLSLWNVQALIPVPLHPRRFRQRGYNQAEEIAKKFSYWLEELYGTPDAVAKNGVASAMTNEPWHLPVDTDLLQRTAYTRPQREFGATERARNVAGAFRASAFARYHSVVLIDDIYTSGATLDACARELKRAGVECVYFLTASVVS